MTYTFTETASLRWTASKQELDAKTFHNAKAEAARKRLEKSSVLRLYLNDNLVALKRKGYKWEVIA